LIHQTRARFLLDQGGRGGTWSCRWHAWPRARTERTS